MADKFQVSANGQRGFRAAFMLRAFAGAKVTRKFLGLEADMGAPWKTKTEHMMIACLYKNGFSAPDIATVFMISRETVLRIWREKEVPEQPVLVPKSQEKPKPSVIDGDIPWPIPSKACVGRR